MIFPDYLALLDGAGGSDGPTQGPGGTSGLAPTVTAVNNTIRAKGETWPAGYGVTVTLTAVDPDGDADVEVTQWVADRDYPLADVVAGLANHIDSQPHFRAAVVGGEILVTTSDPDYTGSVGVELITP